MDRQKVSRILSKRTDQIPTDCSEVARQGCVLFSRENVRAWQDPEEKLALENVIRNMVPFSYDEFDSNKICCTRFYYALDGDVELVIFSTARLGVSFRGSDSPAKELSDILVYSSILEVHLRRRQSTWINKRVGVAVKLHRNHRGSLLAEDGILGAEGDFVIVVPQEMVPDKQGEFRFSYKGSGISTSWPSYEQALYFAQRMRARLKENWVKATLVCGIPKEEGATTSHSGKTIRLHQVNSHNPVAGYAEWVMELSAQQESDPAETSLVIVCDNPDGLILGVSRQEIKLEGTVDTLLAFSKLGKELTNWIAKQD